MAKLYITEYTRVCLVEGQSFAQIGLEPGTDQTPMTVTGSSGQSAAFAAHTSLVRVHTDAICSIAFGDDPTASANNKRLAANQTEYFGVVPGQKLAAITNT